MTELRIVSFKLNKGLSASKDQVQQFVDLFHTEHLPQVYFKQKTEVQLNACSGALFLTNCFRSKAATTIWKQGGMVVQ